MTRMGKRGMKERRGATNLIKQIGKAQIRCDILIKKTDRKYRQGITKGKATVTLKMHEVRM